MLNPTFFQHYRPLPSRIWTSAVANAWSGLERLTRTDVVVEDFEPPSSPVLLATNSTQKYDFMPIRVELRRRKIPLVTITKGKNYHSRAMGFVLKRVGVIPLASRGYILLVDFTSVMHRRPTEAEYRSLRSYLDEGVALESNETFERLAGTPRDILGIPFDPRRSSLREALNFVYTQVMSETLRLTRQTIEAGCHVQIYPEGTVSSRLGEGRIGTVQFARALGIPIVPVGMSGCREAFRGNGIALRGGQVTLRFGKPWSPPLAALPASFRPFHPADETLYRSELRAATAVLMQQIDALLEPSYQRAPGEEGAGTRGTARFL